MSTWSSESEFPEHLSDQSFASDSSEVDERATIANALVVGALAGLAASGLMLWIGRAWGGSILVQLFAERTTAELPLSVFREALGSLEENAKPVALIGITAGQVIAAAFGALVYGRFTRRGWASRLAGGAVLAFTAWFALAFLAAPLGGVGVLALDSPLGTGRTQVSFILTALAYGVMVAALTPWPAFRSAPLDPGRRSILRMAGAGALAIPALWAARYIGTHANRLRTVADTDAAFREDTGAGTFEVAGMPEFNTPVGAFYVVSKNIVDPRVNELDWSLEIDGMVDRPLSLSYSDILARGGQEMPGTLECISNRVGGTYISNTIWTGFPMRDLLEEAGLQDGVVDVRLEAADGYSESFPLAKAMEPDTIVAFLMDGQPLTHEHGYPARLIVPNIYGMKNVKWLTRIEAVDFDYQGYWQERGWSDVAIVLTMSRIDVPRRGYKAQLGEIVPIGGVAFAGDRGISKVEVTLDGGETWQGAVLSPVPSGRTWRLWRYDYLADEPGIRQVAVRATDGAGELQDPVEREALPDGSTGYHRDWFEVLDERGQSVDVNGRSVAAAARQWLKSDWTAVASSGRD